jgi:hypothetical protein
LFLAYVFLIRLRETADSGDWLSELRVHSGWRVIAKSLADATQTVSCRVFTHAQLLADLAKGSAIKALSQDLSRLLLKIGDDALEIDLETHVVWLRKAKAHTVQPSMSTICCTLPVKVDDLIQQNRIQKASTRAIDGQIRTPIPKIQQRFLDHIFDILRWQPFSGKVQQMPVVGGNKTFALRIRHLGRPVSLDFQRGFALATVRLAA